MNMSEKELNKVLKLGCSSLKPLSNFYKKIIAIYKYKKI